MRMTERDNFGNWCMFLLGGFMVSTGVLKLYRYAMTGNAHHPPSRLLPLDLAGSDAAMFYVCYFLAGAFILAAGIRGLTSK